jgi:hypothetical protein
MGLVRTDQFGPAGQGGTGGQAQRRRARRPAKLRLLGARVRGGRLVGRVGMTSRASGRLRATYVSSGRRTRFSLRIPRARRGRPLTWTARHQLPAAQRARRTGILVLRYAGNSRVRPDRLRARVANRRARLRRTRSAIDGNGALEVGGTVSLRARGIVRVRMDWVDDAGSDVNVLSYRARIRGGRWALREQLPAKAARAGGQLSIQYTGHYGRRIRGEQVTKRVAAQP